MTVQAIHDTYLYLSPQATQNEARILNVYMQMPYPTGTVITKPFTIWRKREGRYLSYTCRSLCTQPELLAFYDDFFQKQGAEREVYRRKTHYNDYYSYTVVSTTYTYKLSGCHVSIRFNKDDPI